MLPSLRGLVAGRVTEVFVLRKQPQVVPAPVSLAKKRPFLSGQFRFVCDPEQAVTSVAE